MRMILRVLCSVILCGLTVSLLKMSGLLHLLRTEFGMELDYTDNWNLGGLMVCMGSYLVIWLFYFLVFSGLIIKSIDRHIKKLDERLAAMTLKEMLYSVLGCISGLAAANLICVSLRDFPYGGAVNLLLCLFLGTLGFNAVQKKRGEFDEKSRVDAPGRSKILDTSVIIDGRILDILKTGFIEGKIIIPNFVLEELRHIADSSDPLKRSRGRLGLDVLNQIQSQTMSPVEIVDWHTDKAMEVDSKLLKMAAEMDAFVVTNDYNLNKVAEFQRVSVLNINELSNAVKAIVLPGQEMKINVIKDGKEAGQGIAYLNDGTMIVVENGRQYIGDEIDAIVTSILQTAAGRMIFVKPNESYK